MARLTPETERFLRKAVAGLPFLKRSEAKDELRAHLEDAIQHRIAQGTEQARAEQESVTALGDVAALNRELLRAHFGKKWLLYFILHKVGWWIPNLPHIRLRPGFLIWKSGSKFGRQYAQGHYDEIIVRLERELESRGPNDDIHHELGLAYNAIGDHNRALTHLQAAVDWCKAHPRPKAADEGRYMGLSVAYSNLAGVLKTLDRDEEGEAAVRDGLAGDAKSFTLNTQLAEYYLKRGDLDGTFHHLEASLNDKTEVINSDLGKILLLFLSTDRFDAVRQDSRFSALVQRAYSIQSDGQKTRVSFDEAEAAMRGDHPVKVNGLLQNCQQASHCLERGDLDGTFDHLEAPLNNSAADGDPGRDLLLILSSDVFDPLRNDPRFGQLLMLASHHS